MSSFRTAPILMLPSRRACHGADPTTPGSSTTMTAAPQVLASAASLIQPITEPPGTPAWPFAPATALTWGIRSWCTTRAWACGLPATWRPAAVAKALACGLRRMASVGPPVRAPSTSPQTMATVRACGWTTTPPALSTGECTSPTTTLAPGAHSTSLIPTMAPLGRRYNSTPALSATSRSPATCKAVAVFT
jgi:hypothetical protein